jgi:penicillin-binding protein 1C
MDALQRGAPARAAPAAAPPRLVPVALQAAAGATAPPAATGPRPPPEGVVMQRVAFPAGLEPARDEWFLAGTETARVALASAAGTGARRIASPEDGSVVAIDPDMPPAVQRLRFEAAAPVPPGASWRLDGKRLGPARPLAWSPWPGRHVLELVTAGGMVADAVTFDVRGALAPPARALRR